MSESSSYSPKTAGVLALAAGALMLWPAPENAPADVLMVAGLTLLVIGIWATDCLPEHVAALVFFALATILSLAPPATVFSGFATSAFWLVFGGLVLGAAAVKTGLGAWIAAGLVRRVSSSYCKLLAAIVIGATVLGFLFPSVMARCFILVPIMQAVADRVGFPPGDPGRKGMVLAAAVGTFVIPANILSANLPTVLLVGTAERLFGLEITYAQFLIIHFPVAGVIKGVLLVGLLTRLFPAVLPARRPELPPAPLTDSGRRLLWLSCLALVLWITDFLHGTAPGWIALVAAIFCIMPGAGLLDSDDLRTRVSYPTLLFTASVIGLGAVVAETGLGAYFAELSMEAIGLDGQGPGAAFATVSGLTVALGLFATLPGTMVILSNLAGEVAAAGGLDVATVLMTVVNAGSNIFFPYQVGPVLVALKLGGVSMRDGVRVLAPLALLSLAVLSPLTFWWWRLLGYL